MDSVSQETNLRLIKEIGKRPCLYNKNLVSYNRKSIQDKAWDEVAKRMGWKASSCKDRWRNLRCVYIRHIRKLRQGIHNRPYYLMDAMRFALPFITSINHPPLPPNLLEENENEELEENIDEDEHQFKIQKSFDSSSMTKLHMSSVSPEPGQSFVTVCVPSPGSQIKNEDISQSSSDIHRFGRHNSDALKNILKTASSNDVHVEISDVTPNLELQDDAKKMFLLSLLPDVYAMSDVQMRTFKREVLNIIGHIFDSGKSSQC